MKPWPVRLPPALRERQRWITPEPLNLAPELVGQPLATPWRRAWAMAIDLAVVGMLTGISGAWLWLGLALVLLQLHNRPREAPARRRQWVGWAAAALIAFLAVGEVSDRVAAWWSPAPAAAASAASEDAPSEDAASEEAESRIAPAEAAASSATPSDAERIAALQAQLLAAEREAREARRALAEKPTGLREHLSRFLDDLGAGLGWGIVYFSLLPAWWGGQTVGKKLMRLRVLELTGKPVTVMHALKRYGGYAAGLATGGLGFLQILWDPNRQALHDKAAHTVVVDLRLKPAMPPALAEPLAEPPAQPPAA